MKTLILAVMATLSLGLLGCGGAATSNNTNAAKPANSNSNSSANKDSNSAKKDDKPKTQLAGSKKPAGEGKTADKKIPVPANWIYVYDDQKGYGFSVPEGTTGGTDSVEGMNVFVGATPAPAEVAIYVLAYKDKSLTKDDLLDHAVKFLEGMGETVTAGKLTGESEDYSVADASTTSSDGSKSKVKILVGTDVSDNYVMIVGTDEAKFDANKDIIDAIWGSFEIWSGGASGNS